MKMSDRMILKDRLKKLGLFCLIVFIPVLVVAVVLYSVGVPEWANMLVLVVMLLALFCVFMYVCSVLEKRKEKRLKESGKKDPFSEQ